MQQPTCNAWYASCCNKTTCDYPHKLQHATDNIQHATLRTADPHDVNDCTIRHAAPCDAQQRSSQCAARRAALLAEKRLPRHAACDSATRDSSKAQQCNGTTAQQTTGESFERCPSRAALSAAGGHQQSSLAAIGGAAARLSGADGGDSGGGDNVLHRMQTAGVCARACVRARAWLHACAWVGRVHCLCRRVHEVIPSARGEPRHLCA